MYRFISLVWPKGDQNTSETANFISEEIQKKSSKWQKILDIEGMMVLHIEEKKGQMQAYPLRNPGSKQDNGVILGKLFKRGVYNRDSCDLDQISPQESAEISQSHGRHLVNEYWGRYVAFLDDNTTHVRYIVRDPMGEFPCYYLDYKGVEIYFSYMPDMGELDFINFSFNWKHIASFMAFGNLKTDSSGFNEVTELLAGQCKEVHPNKKTTSFYWDPVRVAQTNIIEDPEIAAREIYRVTRDCVRAWASCYKNIFHNLSGGLDSSIILSCLKDMPPPFNVSCLNYYTSEKEGDERFFAQRAAEHAGLPLYETKLSSKNIDLKRILKMAKGAKPENYIFERAKNHFDPNWVKEKAPEACFYGSGGDNVFFQPHTHLGVIDYVNRHGFDANMLTVAMEAARLERNSFWAILVIAVKSRFKKSHHFPHNILMSEDTATMSPDILQSLNLDDTLHPALRVSHKTPPGKLLHISIATSCPSYYEPIETEADFLEPVLPLFSQPLVELCLRIPTWVLTTGGKDRGLARMAFAKDLPPEILRRESKGGADTLFDTILKEQMPFIKSLLLDGILVKQGLLDRPYVEKIISRTDGSISAELVRILFHMCTESWVRNWSAKRPGLIS